MKQQKNDNNSSSHLYLQTFKYNQNCPGWANILIQQRALHCTVFFVRLWEEVQKTFVRACVLWCLKESTCIPSCSLSLLRNTFTD